MELLRSVLLKYAYRCMHTYYSKKGVTLAKLRTPATPYDQSAIDKCPGATRPVGWWALIRYFSTALETIIGH